MKQKWCIHTQSNLHLTASTHLHIFRVVYLITQVVFLEVTHVIYFYQGMVWLQGKGQTHSYMYRKLQWVSWWWSWGEVPLSCSALFCPHSWGQGSVQSRDKADVREDSYFSTQQLYKTSTPFSPSNSVHCWTFLHYAFQWAENALWWTELKIHSAGEMCEHQRLACPKVCSKGLNLTCMLRGNMIISAGTVKANIHSTLQKQAQKLRYIVAGSQTGQIQSDAGWDCFPSNWRICTEQTGVFFLLKSKALRSTRWW